MGTAPQLDRDETLDAPPVIVRETGRAIGWLRSAVSGPMNWTRVRQAGYSIADQALAVGGMFLANVALARTQSKEEYGIFALSYSVFTFLAGLHNAAVLEADTIYGSGRCHRRFPAYAWLFWGSKLFLGLGGGAVVAPVWGVVGVSLPAC